MQVKQAITGYGKAVKKQIQEMTRMLHLESVPSPTIPPTPSAWRLPTAIAAAVG